METLTITEEERDGLVIAQLAGSASVDQEAILERAFMRLAALDHKLLVFDLSQLTFISSLGMGAFVSLIKAAKRHETAVRLAAAQPSIYEAFKRARLTDRFEFYDDLDSAINATE